MYIDKRKAKKKNRYEAREALVAENAEEKDNKDNSAINTNVQNTFVSKGSSKKTNNNATSQFDLESQTLDPNSAATLMSGRSGKQVDPLWKQKKVYTDENILTRVEEFALSQRTIFNIDLLIMGGSSHMISNYTTTAQNKQLKIRVYLERTVHQEKILNAKYS